jgi:hypothetical protein
MLALAALAAPAGAMTAVPTPAVLTFNPAMIGGEAGSPQQLTVSFAVTGITGTFAPTATLHYGIDYTAGEVSCTGSAPAETCTVAVSFQPTLPGGRKDALFLMDGTTRLATVLLGGIGQGPLSLIQPGVVTNLTPGVTFDNYGSAVDENGTVYVLTGNTVHSVTKADVVTQMPIASTPQLNGIAIDGAGVLYISQNTSFMSSLLTYDTVAAVQGTRAFPEIPSPPCYWWESLMGAATDLRGDVFTIEMDNYCTNLFGLEPNGSTGTTAISPSITQPATIAADSSGDVFLGGDYTINEIVSGGGQSAVNTQGAEEGLAVDAAGTLYATRYPGGGVAELPASNYNAQMASLDSGEPLGLSLGSDGTLYVGNYTSLDKVDRSQGAINFGEQHLSTPATRDFYVYNGGNQDLTVTSVNVDPGDLIFSVQQTTPCPFGAGGSGVIPPGELCAYQVTMNTNHPGTPTGTVSVYTDSLYGESTQLVALSGVVYGAYVTASPNSLSFGMVGLNAPATLPVTLTNNGAFYNAQLGGATFPAGYSYPANACSSIPPGGGMCTLNITFDPTVQETTPPGAYIAIPVSSQAGDSSTVRIYVSGIGSIVTLNPSPLSFTAPENATSFPQKLTLANTGTAPVTIYNIVAGGANPGAFTVYPSLCTGGGGFPVTLAGNSQCPIYVTFNPPLVTGTATPPGDQSLAADVEVSDSDTATSPQIAQVSGISTPPLPVPLAVAETLHLSDAEALALAIQLKILETLHTSDTLTSIAPAVQLAINEQIHTSDAPVLVPAGKTPTITWPTLKAITYGTALSATELDATASVAGTFAYTPAAGAVPGAGSQTLQVTFTPSDLVDYLPATATVTLAVNPALLTLTAKNASMTYGASLPAFAYAVTGFVNGDTAATALTGAPSLSTAATSQSPVGSYPIAAGPGTLASSTNYTVTFNNGVLAINPAALTVTATNLSVPQGSAIPPLTYTLSGFVNGNTASVVSGSPALSTTATSSSPVGNYPIAVTQGTLSAANYSFNHVNGTLSVLTPLTVVLTTTASLTGSASAGYTATITVTNTGTATASNVVLTSATLGSVTGTPLPQTLAGIGPNGGTGTFVVHFAGSAGKDGAGVAEKYSGAYTGGTFSASVKSVTLP